MTTLQKRDGGVRIVAGDALRRLVARTIVQQLSEAVERTLHRFSMRSPPVRVVSALHIQAPSDLNPATTITSIV